MDAFVAAALKLDKAIEQAPAFVSIAAGAALLLLLPLYFSQRRDLKRLVAWHGREPEHPSQDVAASELILDRAEAELEQLVATEPEPATQVRPAPATASTAAKPETGDVPLTAAQRVTSERPALERITMEREALAPHPRWRRFTQRVMKPRWLIGIAVVAVLLAGAAIFGSELLLQLGDEERAPRAGGVDPSDVTVAVLNATTVPALGGKVADDVVGEEYDLGVVTTFEPRDQTVVMYEDGKGNQPAARRVARALGGAPVQPIDGQAQAQAEGADVVVIAGQDRGSA